MATLTSALAADVQTFVSASSAIFAEGKARATALPANTVQVWPGGATFTTIQAAIDSITNASPQLQYQVAVGSGTFSEFITMKDNIYIIGSGQGVTFLNGKAQQNVVGIVNSASNAGISELSISAIGGSWGDWPVCIKIASSGNFHMSGVSLTATDIGNGGSNIRLITDNTGSYSGNLILGQSGLVSASVAQTTATGIELFGMGGMQVFCELSSINMQGPTTYGVTTAVNATATLEDCKISATTFALYNSDGTALITANQCTIVGPVSAGVVVNN